MSDITTIYLDLLPSYIPFLIQATKADGAKSDPTVDNLIIYEDAGTSSAFGTGSISSSPFDPAKINSKTGLWGVKIAKSELTAGRYYYLLWEVTVDSVTTAKQQVFFATNASNFKADVSGLSTFDASTDSVDIGSVNGTSVTSPSDLKADVSGLSTFDASTDSVDIGSVNGTSVTGPADLKADVSSLATSASITALESHGDSTWATATGFSTHSANDVVTAMQSVADDFMADVSGLSTFDPATATVDVGAVNGTPTTGIADFKATGFSTHAASDVVTAMQSVADDFMADVSGLSTFDPATATVDVGAVNGTPTTGIADFKATGFSTHAASDVVSAMQVVADDFMADVSGLASESDQTAIKAVTDKLDTAVEIDGAEYRFTANALEQAPSGGGGTDVNVISVNGTSVTGPADLKADVSGLATSSSITALESHGDSTWATATGFSTHAASDVVTAMQAVASDFMADVSSLAVASDQTAIKAVTDKLDTALELDGAVYRLTSNALEEAPAGGGVGTDVNVISVNGTSVTGPADLKADVSGLATSASITALESHGDSTWATATGFSTHAASDVVTAMQAVASDFMADVSDLATDFDTLAIKAVTDKLDTALELDGAVYRLTSNALEEAPAGGGVGTDVNVISVAGTSVVGPSDFKATGFSTHTASDVVSAMQLVAADFKADVSGLATSASITALESHGDSTWATATGFSTHAASDVVSAMQVVADDFMADVSGLASDTDQTAIKTVTDKLDTALEADAGVHRFTANALEEAPTAGSLDADVVAGCTEALNAYDPPTRSETTSDKNEILAAVGGGATGARTVEITVVDSGGSPVPDVSTGVYNSDGTVLLTAGMTGPSGNLNVALDDGDYSIVFRKGGYSFTVPESITVTSDDAFTFSAAELVISLPASPDECRVYDWVYHAGDSIPSNVDATARIIRLPFDYEGRLYTGRAIRARADVSGFIFWDLPRGASVHFSIPEAGVTRVADIPASSSARLTDI